MSGHQMKRGYADGPYGQIHYHDSGSGRPLVLIHQAPIRLVGGGPSRQRTAPAAT